MDAENSGKNVIKIILDTSEIDALEEKIERMNEKLKEAKSLAGEIASKAELNCSIKLV